MSTRKHHNDPATTIATAAARLAVATLLAALAAACSGDGSASDADATSADTQEDAAPDAEADSGADLLPQDVPADNLPADSSLPDGFQDVAAETEEDAAVPPPEFPLLAQPEGVLVKDGRVFVTNTNGAWDANQNRMVYQPGYVTVLDAADLSYAGQVELGFLNPQFVVDLGPGRVAVVCSGSSVADANWTMTPAASGAVIVLDSDSLDDLGSVEIVAGNPTPLAGFPGPASYDPGADTLYVGSGTSACLYRVDVSPEGIGTAPEVIEIYPDDGMNDSIIPFFHEGTVYAASFNKGTVSTVAAGQGKPGSEPFDVTETDQLEGPVDLRVAGNTLYVLLTISAKVAALDLSSTDVSYPFVTGATPNRLAMSGNFLFSVNSGENNLTRYDLSKDETTQSFVAFEPGTNPWEMAVADNMGYVTGYMTSTLVKVDLAAGKVEKVLKNQ